MKLTTVPFFLPKGKYKNIDHPQDVGAAPVFHDLPTEEDFEIAVSSIKWGLASKRVVIDFDLLIIKISKSKDYWFLGQEHSYREPKTSFYIDKFESFDAVIEKVKTLTKEEKEFIESLMKKLDRALK